MLAHQDKSTTKVRILAGFLIVLEVGMMVAYGVGSNIQTNFLTTSDQSSQIILYLLPALLAILGWGLIISYSENSAISGLITTLLAVGLSVQLQPLLDIFWKYVFNGFDG